MCYNQPGVFWLGQAVKMAKSIIQSISTKTENKGSNRANTDSV